MMKMWGDFAKTGNPTPADGAWRAWDSIEQSKMNINQVLDYSKPKPSSQPVTTALNQDSLTLSSDARGTCDELWNKWTVFWDIPSN